MRRRGNTINNRSREDLENSYLYWSEQAMVDIVEDYEEWSNLKLENTISILRDIVFESEKRIKR